jgi:tRNA-specific 2-thiouridylase
MAEKIVVGLSGGVDSSVAALLLKQAGHNVSAVFMKNWTEPEPNGTCRWEDEVADALAVCETLGIPFNTVDLSREYWDAVFSDFLREYGTGRTPNPDVLCNREIKFKAFLDHARTFDAARIATGHYARITADERGCHLLKGIDAQKDQSYFLYALTQDQLRSAVFPVGELTKPEVRRIARQAGLSTHAKKDSAGLCFVGERDFRSFLARYLPSEPGEIKTEDGRTIGEHPGVCYFTIGQREGLGIGGVRGESEAPWYVIDKDPARNVLIVGQRHDHPALMSRRLSADKLHWIAGEAPAAPLRCRAKVRYRQADQACTVHPRDANRCEVTFDRPQRAVAPGQSVVFYAGDECLGGGIIGDRG